METIDKTEYIKRYEGRLSTFGYDPKTLGWGNEARQEVRFLSLAEEALQNPESSVLDVGCGFADLYAFLRANGWKGKYTGVDIVPGLLETAKQVHPDLDLRVYDITSDTGLEQYDYVIGSGLLNARLTSGNNEEHSRIIIRAMYALAKKCACIDAMSTMVDFQKEGAWHTDPAWMIQEGMKLTNKFRLTHNYMPFEFSMFLYKENETSSRRVFASFEDKLNSLESRS